MAALLVALDELNHVGEATPVDLEPNGSAVAKEIDEYLLHDA